MAPTGGLDCLEGAKPPTSFSGSPIKPPHDIQRYEHHIDASRSTAHSVQSQVAQPFALHAIKKPCHKPSIDPVRCLELQHWHLRICSRDTFIGYSLFSFLQFTWYFSSSLEVASSAPIIFHKVADKMHSLYPIILAITFHLTT